MAKNLLTPGDNHTTPHHNSQQDIDTIRNLLEASKSNSQVALLLNFAQNAADNINGIETLTDPHKFQSGLQTAIQILEAKEYRTDEEERHLIVLKQSLYLSENPEALPILQDLAQTPAVTKNPNKKIWNKVLNFLNISKKLKIDELNEQNNIIDALITSFSQGKFIFEGPVPNPQGVSLAKKIDTYLPERGFPGIGFFHNGYLAQYRRTVNNGNSITNAAQLDNWLKTHRSSFKQRAEILIKKKKEIEGEIKKLQG